MTRRNFFKLTTLSITAVMLGSNEKIKTLVKPKESVIKTKTQTKIYKDMVDKDVAVGDIMVIDGKMSFYNGIKFVELA